MTAQPPKFRPHTAKRLLEDPLLRADFASESFGGGSHVACALGNGQLTVGISPWAEVVYFRWPTLSFYDHLNYSTISHGVWGQLKTCKMFDGGSGTKRRLETIRKTTRSGCRSGG